MVSILEGKSCARGGPGVLSTQFRVPDLSLLLMKAEREEPMLVPVCPCPFSSP